MVSMMKHLHVENGFASVWLAQHVHDGVRPEAKLKTVTLAEGQLQLQCLEP